ncbi:MULTISPECIES: hypothetical protein [Flavobacterium]|uniref:Uncharacterized protein n=1 Tax=Flavobacterium jumunjinense TaxID=998845 RepID=A0ABV5GVK2_9FLAO|nr:MULTISPECIES: hypothetical protein [Flavobacterium]
MSKKANEETDPDETSTYQVVLSSHGRHMFFGTQNRSYLVVATNLDDKEVAVLEIAKSGVREVGGTMRIFPNETNSMLIKNSGSSIFVLNRSESAIQFFPKIGVSIFLAE